MRDALVSGVIVGLFALAGGAAGSYLAAAQIAKVAVAHAPTSAEVAIARLQADPVLRRQG
jgi:hypothetical protein